MDKVQTWLEELDKAKSMIPWGQVHYLDRTIRSVSSPKIWIAGNGGSASIADHFACELIGCQRRVSSTFQRPFNVESLTTNGPLLTCLANDYGRREIFTLQLEDRIQRDDWLLLLSGSGHSLNVVHAASYGQARKARVWGFCGEPSKEGLAYLPKYCHDAIVVESKNQKIIEECLFLILHTLAYLLGGLNAD